jgi:hypothetical protein
LSRWAGGAWYYIGAAPGGTVVIPAGLRPRPLPEEETVPINPRIRASDAERDHVAAQLREHYAAGRLSLDECQERVSATLAARTFGELGALSADLPDLVPAAAGPRRPGAAGRRAAAAGAPSAPCDGDKVAGLVALGIIAAAYVVTGLATGIWWFPWAVVVVPIVVTIRRARRRGAAAGGPAASAS